MDERLKEKIDDEFEEWWGKRKRQEPKYKYPSKKAWREAYSMGIRFGVDSALHTFHLR